MNLEIFRAYDIRGIFGVDFEPKDFYRIACAYADCFQPKTVALGHDVRESSLQLWQQVVAGFQDSGVHVLDLGQISTDMLYFAVAHYQADGGIVISASHNPAMYNGMKLVRKHAAPLSADTGLFDVRDAVKNGSLFAHQKGTPTRHTSTVSVSGCLLSAPSLVCRLRTVVQKADCYQRQ